MYEWNYGKACNLFLTVSSVQSLSCVWLLVTQWTAASQASCSLPTPRANSNLCPSSQWCHPTISASVSPSPLALNLLQHQGLFQWVSSSHHMAKVLEFQLQHLSFQWIFRTDFLYDWLVGSPCSRRYSQESFPTSQFKSINSLALNFLYGPTLISIHDHCKIRRCVYGPLLAKQCLCFFIWCLVWL